jgi:predicted pyridoxine 5'-phosphate oxidase superfamily flavin-nucleotide-binding protein
MAKLPDNVKALLLKGHEVWVATVGNDGWPNVAIKGSGALFDQDHLYFADMYSKKTRANIEANPRVAVGIWDPKSGIAVQVKGTAEMVPRGPSFDDVARRIAPLNKTLPPIEYIVRIHVEEVSDMGVGPHAGERIA